MSALDDLKASIEKLSADQATALVAIQGNIDSLNAKLTAALATADNPDEIAAMQADVAAMEAAVQPFLPPAPPAPVADPVPPAPTDGTPPAAA